LWGAGWAWRHAGGSMARNGRRTYGEARGRALATIRHGYTASQTLRSPDEGREAEAGLNETAGGRRRGGDPLRPEAEYRAGSAAARSSTEPLAAASIDPESMQGGQLCSAKWPSGQAAKGPPLGGDDGDDEHRRQGHHGFSQPWGGHGCRRRALSASSRRGLYCEGEEGPRWALLVWVTHGIETKLAETERGGPIKAICVGRYWPAWGLHGTVWDGMPRPASTGSRLAFGLR